MSEHDPTEYVLDKLIEALAECYACKINPAHTQNLEQLCNAMFEYWMRQ